MKKKLKIPLLEFSALVLLLLLTNSLVSRRIAPLLYQAVPLTLSAIPTKAGGAFTRPEISAASAIVLDPESSVVLYQKNPDLILPPASTTKMMTGLLTLENMPLENVVLVGRINVEPQIMKLVLGERLTVRDLLYGTLVWSANDGAETLAGAFPGGREEFIARMNKKAKDLGMLNTHFVNPSGLPDPAHYSTARDLARFSTQAMKNQEFAQIVGTKEITVKSVDGKTAHRLVNLNELLGKVQGVLGIKTGWIDESGGALVSFVRRDNREIVVVVLDSWDRFGDSEKLIDWVYKNFEWVGTGPQNSDATVRSK